MLFTSAAGALLFLIVGLLPPAPPVRPLAASVVYLPLVGRAATAARPPVAQPTPHALRLPLVATLHEAPALPLKVLPAPTPALPTAVAQREAPPQPPGPASCTTYRDVRITWYELGSCCDKAPGHPEYGITRSGLPATWGMAAVQARVPLLPMGTRFYVADIGPAYTFVVADTGSEMAFGSSWVDLYAPTIEIGLWLERQVADGRSDVLVCAQSQ